MFQHASVLNVFTAVSVPSLILRVSGVNASLFCPLLENACGQIANEHNAWTYNEKNFIFRLLPIYYSDIKEINVIIISIISIIYINYLLCFYNIYFKMTLK